MSGGNSRFRAVSGLSRSQNDILGNSTFTLDRGFAFLTIENYSALAIGSMSGGLHVVCWMRGAQGSTPGANYLSACAGSSTPGSKPSTFRAL
jgi:hypothetical protein